MEAPVGGLILQQKWEEVAKYVFQHILRDMPKNDRFTLGADIRSLVWEVEAAAIQLSLRAGNRWQLLNLVDIKAKTLFAMIRLGIQIGAIAQKRYEPISLKLVEIGKIVGGLEEARWQGVVLYGCRCVALPGIMESIPARSRSI